MLRSSVQASCLGEFLSFLQTASCFESEALYLLWLIDSNAAKELWLLECKFKNDTEDTKPNQKTCQ